MNIILTGFMGSGKTTVGRETARLTGRHFVDTDELIVQRSGRSISQIFDEDGQAAFRQWEALVTLELASQSGLVIATGGRLMLDPANAIDLGEGNAVVCLTAEPETILARLADDDVRRPLLDVPNPEYQIRRLLDRRAEAYGRFVQLATDGKSVGDVAQEIAQGIAEKRFPVYEAGWTEKLPVRYPLGEYHIFVGQEALPRIGQLAGIQGQAVLISDRQVGPLYAGHCRDLPLTGQPILIPVGEAHKRLETVRDLYDQMLAAQLDRQGTVVALGGGVVGDAAGFAAATYMRGVALVQVPTTLLAMVDASVGGKTGVDLPQGKNLVGAFKQPIAVIADLDTLLTLPPEEAAAGMAEVIKHGLIASPALLRQVEAGDWRWPAQSPSGQPLSRLQSLVLRAIQVKRDVVEDDPFESGRRAVLNLGHTFAHAIEQVSGYAVAHGPAVAMGLVAAINLSARLGCCAAALQPRIETLLTNVGLPTRMPAGLAPADLLRAMERDKKKAAGKLRFILLRDIADLFITDEVPEEAVLATLEAVKSEA